MAASVETIKSNAFWLDMGQAQISSISEVSGLEDESDVVELSQVAEKGKLIVTKGLGANPLKVGKLTVKYAAFKTDPMRKWREDVIGGKIANIRKDITIHLYTREAGEEMSFSFRNAWPSKYSFSSFTSKSNEAVMITVTLEHEGMSVKGYNS